MVFTVKARHFPSLFYTKRELAEQEAQKHGVEICFIEYEGHDIGYGLYDCECEKLLETSDFAWV